jgi:3-deoxy-manno-octulosonate cytidylyltransferase (CMP-KDO synthetase)
MQAVGVIPARYGATRLPGKPLLDICGKPLLRHVFERASQSRLAEVLVATDDQRIHDYCQANAMPCVLTAATHATGTDRVAEVMRDRGEDVVVNIQGDEPLIDPAVIDAVAGVLLQDPNLDMATAKKSIIDKIEIDNPNVVKVVTDAQGDALYFSRSVIPYPRGEHAPHYKHIGIYGYRRSALLRLAALQPVPLERAESLEQLRALYHGMKIRVVETDYESVGVDTMEDLQCVRTLLQGKS